MQLRSLLFKTAEDLGGTGFDYDYGWGALNPKALLSSLKALKTSKTASTGNGHARLTQPGKTRKGLPKHHAGMGI